MPLENNSLNTKAYFDTQVITVTSSVIEFRFLFEAGALDCFSAAEIWIKPLKLQQTLTFFLWPGRRSRTFLSPMDDQSQSFPKST